jgi:RNA polymerase sigma-70 factor, ECF subfamily
MKETPISQTRLSTPTGGSERDQDEFVQLLIEHERRLEGFVLAMVPDWTAAEDIVQETKLRLWKQFDGFDRSRNFGAWARTIAYYQVLAYRKSNQRSREHLFSDDFLQSVAQEESSREAEIVARQRFLAGCLKKLNDRARELLKLVYSGNDTIRQVAQRLGRGEAATYTAVQDARLRLHKCLEKELRKEELR